MLPRRSGEGLVIAWNKAPMRFTFGDLKSESDASLAYRLMGENGRRVAYVDRHPARWQYYSADSEPIDQIDLYTHPYALGSQYGLCGVEKYTVSFGDDARIASVAESERYGIEGPIFQKSGFDWDYYNGKMCAAAAPDTAPSYFPAPDAMTGYDAARLLTMAIDLSASSAKQPAFALGCTPVDGKEDCKLRIRHYLASLRLKDIDAFSLLNCSLAPRLVCFTVKVGDGKLGPFPKMITVRGSTFMNDFRVDAVTVSESFTVS